MFTLLSRCLTPKSARQRDTIPLPRGRGPKAALMKAVERATANKSLHTPNLGGKAIDKAGYRGSLRDTTELGQCREFETATVLLTNAPSATATAQAVDLAG
jgi:hypothetical protein